jgi:hypothetical protein
VAEGLAAIRAALEFPRLCTDAVVRAGESQPCEKPAVALRYDPSEERHPYPVCAYHARGDMVSLPTLLAAVREVS